MMRHRSYLCLLPLVVVACGGGNDPARETPELVIGGEGTDAHAASLYQMPTPNELFSLVRDMAGASQEKMLNPAANASRYVSLKGRAVNFGVYATDLVFASYFRMNAEVARYYLTTKRMAEGLGIASAFTEDDFIRLERNLARGNSDSLEVISSEAYMQAYAKLQDEKMGPVLAMVLAGGWVESMHLVIRQIEMHGRNEALLARVAEQKVTLEHLVDMMAEHADDADVQGLRKRLIAVRDVYDHITVKRSAPKGPTASGRMVLGDDVTMEMTDEKYMELVKVVEALRADLTRPEDEQNV
jgi:uncharacterized coiled-coil protein SlyX